MSGSNCFDEEQYHRALCSSENEKTLSTMSIVHCLAGEMIKF
jgi:hypothetical protein